MIEMVVVLVKLVMVNTEMQKKHSKVFINLLHITRHTSTVKRQTSNAKRQTSNVKRQTSNVKRQTSNVKRQTSNVKRHTSQHRSCGNPKFI